MTKKKPEGEVSGNARQAQRRLGDALRVVRLCSMTTCLKSRDAT